MKKPKTSSTAFRLNVLEKSVAHLAEGIAFLHQRTPAEGIRDPARPTATEVRVLDGTSGKIGDPSARSLSIVENEAQVILDCARRLDNYNHRLRSLLQQFGVSGPTNSLSSSDVPPETSLQGARRHLETKISELSDILALTT